MVSMGLLAAILCGGATWLTRTGTGLDMSVAMFALFAAVTLRIMFGVAWKVTLTAELFGGGQGLGYLINVARQDYDTAILFAVILLIIGFVSLADRWVFLPLERYCTRQFGVAA